jgi:hypothetical protein
LHKEHINKNMNTNKHIKHETRRWIERSTILPRSIFLTFHLWDNLSEHKDENTILKIQKITKKFINKLEKSCNASKNRLERIVVIETNTSRNHCHLMIEVPQHLSNKMMVKNIRHCAENTTGIGQHDIRQTYDKNQLINYITKEVNPNKDTIDLENSFFKNHNNRISRYRNGHRNNHMH